jgi:hypothetical protein
MGEDKIMIPILGPIISAIASIGGSWAETRKVKEAGKIELAKAKIDAKVTKTKQMGSMDIEAMKGMQFSWKDEYIMVLMSIPIIMAFIPFLAPYALNGFAVIATMPEWFKWSWMGIVTATFGLRTWMGWRK